MMRLTVTAAILAVSTGLASASGGLSCAVDDDAVTLDIDGGVTRGMGGALFSFAGSVALRDNAVSEDLRTAAFERKHVAQYWLDGEVLWLRLYREREGDAPHGFVELAVETAPNGNGGQYTGEYRVIVHDMTTAEDGETETAEFGGAIECFVE